MELALAADVSQRHLSWLETGKSHPSREMVIRLCEALDVPLRERNALLQAAGYAAVYLESDLQAPSMAPVLGVLTQILEHHDPLPAFVIDRFWNVVKQNRSAGLLLSMAGDLSHLYDGPVPNLALLTLHPEGLRRYIANWDQAAPGFIRRLEREYLASGDLAVRRTLGSYIEMANVLPDVLTEAPSPVMPLELRIGELALSVFSVISTFGTPSDVTTDELRIEAFYPSDESTEAFFANAALN